MQKKISSLPFKGTPEQEQKLQAVIAANRQDPSKLMAVMQEAQEIYGYLPMEVQEMIADGMNVPLEKVYGVASLLRPVRPVSQGGVQHLGLPGAPPAMSRAPAISSTA